MTFTLEDAVRIATEAHKDQTDKSGRPYIGHPMRVMAKVEGQHAKMAAVLHDVIEDTPVTADDLRAAGCPENVVSTVIALSKVKGEPMPGYLRRVAQDPVAVTVKRADIADNSDPVRMSRLEPEVQTRLRAKYAEALRILGELA